MKQMSLIEMDGFLKGKCIPCDLKVNETNAEYLVRKFGELESKLETALRECRSAGITIKDGEWPIDNGIIEVYAAPPVPVVPAALPENDDEDGHDIDYLEPSEVYALGRTAGWNACRAAMLHSAEPASNHEELPLDYLQGQKDGLEWAAQLAEANHPQTGDWIYDDPLELAKAIRKGPDMPEFDGPTPVTPDGWISCSERMPEMGERQCYVLAADFKNNYPPNIPNTQVGVYGDWFNDGNPTWDDGDGEDLYLKEVTHWMPLPEPPQEMK
ncbi:DUF551 domain-containing protein [Escherichia coli]